MIFHLKWNGQLIECGWLIGREEWNGEMNRCVEQSWELITPDRFQLAKGGLRFADAAAELFLRLASVFYGDSRAR